MRDLAGKDLLLELRRRARHDGPRGNPRPAGGVALRPDRSTARWPVELFKGAASIRGDAEAVGSPFPVRDLEPRADLGVPSSTSQTARSSATAAGGGMGRHPWSECRDARGVNFGADSSDDSAGRRGPARMVFGDVLH